MEKQFYKNLKYEVLTPSGFESFAGVSMMGVSPVWRIETARGAFIECTHDHELFVNGEKKVPVSELAPGDELYTGTGFDCITTVRATGNVVKVYDLIEVENGRKYYANGILSSNCKFITFEETLINPAKIAKLSPSDPIKKTGQVRWYAPIRKECSYVISLDPSMGTGGDNAAIEVFEMPTLIQVAEWQHNRTPVEGQMRVLREIGLEIQKQGNPEIYWSVENNTLGEAALVVIRDTGEEHFPGTMLHDPVNKVAGKRKGFGTTNRSKLEACAKLKNFIESDKIQIRSKNLISELKVYVARANTYEARVGNTDDLISSTLLFIRMANYIASWDDLSYQAMNSSLEVFHTEDDESVPMPILMI